MLLPVNARGYLLIEVLAASVLLSLAGASLYGGLMQGMKIDRRVRMTHAAQDPFLRFSLRIEKELRNAVNLRQVLYIGRADEMRFPMMSPENGLRQIRYFVKDSQFIRSEQELSDALGKKEPVERPVFKGMKKIRFQYAYLDENEEIFFHPFWVETPYYGIPKAVIIEAELADGSAISKFISIPQGKWGHLQ